ncbi:MAG TPA: hypothetical protein VHA33_15960 [Candidatus Angelobacter sp.]|nr:hypothetical protein [Candidatus Angelobacter sp.]
MRVHIIALGLFLALVSSVCFCQQPQQVGTAYFSNPINWSQTPDLHFTIQGGQPNTCGELVTFRNGSWLYVPGWACVDGNGNANMGAWTWANTPGDQTDTNVQIIWPNGNYTNATSDHVWDKSCPTISPVPFGSGVPGAFSGTASDNQWGAGFDDGWTVVTATYEDTTIHLFWTPATGSYNSSSGVVVQGEIFGMPSHGINWSFDPLRSEAPSAGAHTAGHSYVWTVYLTDGDQLCSPTAAPGFTD